MKITLEDFKRYTEVKEELYKMGYEFLKIINDITPRGYRPLQTHFNRIAFSYVCGDDEGNVWLVYFDKFADDGSEYFIKVNAKEFFENHKEAACNYVNEFVEAADRKRQEIIEKEQARIKEREIAEYNRIKEKYQL